MLSVNRSFQTPSRKEGEVVGLFEKLYTLFILLSVVIGLIIGQFSELGLYANKLILPLLILMLYVTFLQIPIKEIKNSFFNKKFTYTTIGMNFVITPILAWLLAMIFLADQQALSIGFIMLMVTPCTDWYIIFTAIAKGNTALSTSILPLNLVLQLLLLPVYLYLFSGATGVVDFYLVVKSIGLVLLLPFILAFLTRHYFVKHQQEMIEKIATLPVIFLCLAIVSMFASQGSLLLDNFSLMLKLLLPITVFFFINFLLGRFIGQALTFPKADIASVNLTTLARNSPVALAIAMTAFPHEPFIALVLIIGPLIELPLLAFISRVIVLLDARAVNNSNKASGI